VIGQAPSLGCDPCELFGSCGGVYQSWNCLSECCGDPLRCPMACFLSPNMTKVVRDAGGLGIDQRWHLTQARHTLPDYVPHIGHRSGRSKPLPHRNVAVTTYDVLAAGSKIGRYLSSPAELRDHFKISRQARVLSLSIAKDNRLEAYWKHELSRRLPEQLSALGIQYITTPNYSLPLNAPRTEHLVNIRRSVVCGERMSLAGLSVIPHLNAMTRMDWDRWRDFLRDHPQIHYVALEFQTGLRVKQKAMWHLSQLLNLQESLGRRIHLVAVGGGRHLSYLAEFPAVTIVDSGPFIRTLKRRRVNHQNGKWTITPTAQGEPLHDLLHHNVTICARAVSANLDYHRWLDLKVLSNHSNVGEKSSIPEQVVPLSHGQLHFDFLSTRARDSTQFSLVP
jgi:hypothetical protein